MPAGFFVPPLFSCPYFRSGIALSFHPHLDYHILKLRALPPFVGTISNISRIRYFLFSLFLYPTTDAPKFD